MKNTVITFEQLPQAIYSLTCEVQELRKLIEAAAPLPQAVEILDRKGAAKFLGISEQTIYQMGDKLPRRKRFGKLVFLKSELAEFIITGKKSKLWK
ncbi:helix-turn-helix domain-containing protein [Dyadobacter sp. CY107]|uniref:helix-turn-helix domain-containing protein n=1 Tax=Dyadobacter fanqingshengii TaxID=2906443 RepID=UPI001F1AF718|nr:helix-turn-helix domain-containing protein [Dyadobacter fanqingshengii]MCF2506857.1 helix-turn-helix domain-containing protein [Dyadobacter fanqingshengii]